MSVPRADGSRAQLSDRGAFDALRAAARFQLGSWTRPRPSERARAAVRAGLVRARLRTAAAEPLSSWPGGLLAYALAEAFEVSEDIRDFDAVSSYARRWMDRYHEKPLPNPDYTANGRLLLWLYQRTGAPALLEEARRMAVYLHELPRSRSGLMPYRQIAPDQLYVDSIGIVSPFVADYMAIVPDPVLLRRVLGQADAFLDRALDSESRLPYHGMDDSSGQKLGAVGWGRGVGWLIFGIGELLRGCPGEDVHDPRRTRAFAGLCERVSGFQRPDGSFPWLLQATDGSADASAGGLICCGLQSGAAAGVLSSAACSDALRRGLLNIGSHGVGSRPLEPASAESGGLGIYPQAYEPYPWGVAPNLLVLARHLGVNAGPERASRSDG